MNPLLFSQTNRESFITMCILKGEANTTSFQSSHFVLHNMSQNGGKKETGKAGAEFPPDLLSAPTSFRSRSFDGKFLRDSTDSRLSKQKNYLFPLKERARKIIKRCRDNFSALLSHYGYWTELLEQDLKIYLRIFFKKSSNFGQKTQPMT